MRIGSYEARVSNQFCNQIFKVMPADFDNTRSRYRTSHDGRCLKPVDCYPSTLAETIRRLADFNIRDGIDVPGVDEAIGRAEAIEAEISALADRIGEDARRLEAAS